MWNPLYNCYTRQLHVMQLADTNRYSIFQELLGIYHCYIICWDFLANMQKAGIAGLKKDEFIKFIFT